MNAGKWFATAAILAWGVVAAQAADGPRAIDAKTSTMTVHVFKSGVFSAFGHNHQITAPLTSGMLDVAGRRVELKVRADALRVVDPDASEKDRAEVQTTMVGPEVLDTGRYPEIAFRSTQAESEAGGGWNVTGDLMLHGQSRPVTVHVTEQDGHYTGVALLKQSDFGMKPVKAAGGAVKVKDEIRIEFDIQLAAGAAPTAQ